MKTQILIPAVLALFAISACNGSDKEAVQVSTHDAPTQTAVQVVVPPTVPATVPPSATQQITAKGITLEWFTENGMLACHLSASTAGWVAVGFDPIEAMLGANIIMGYVDANGQVVMRDDFGTGPGAHKPDTDLGGADNISDKKGTEANGITDISFKIPLDSGDSKDKKLAIGKSYQILLATGAKKDFAAIHNNKAVATINIK